MCLVSPQEFLKKEFSKESAPSEHTIRRWIDQGILPGKQIGKLYYVDHTAFSANGNPLVEKILRNA